MAHRVASLFLVFVLAKVVALATHPPPLSPWLAVAYLWQDAVVALLYGALDWAFPRRASWALYGMIAAYTAINAAVVRVLATPLTLPMLRAARGELGDSIRLYVTPANVGVILLILAGAALLPPLMARIDSRRVSVAVVSLVALAALGAVSRSRVDTLGLDRNALLALVESRRTPVAAASAAGRWRVSPLAAVPAGPDLRPWRGVAAGRNVVVVSLESAAARYLALFGGSRPDLMPNLSALAASGVVFDNAYAVYPESIKGLFSALCSQFPAIDSVPEAYAQAPCRSFAEVLAGAGYRTALFHSGHFEYLGMQAIVRGRGFQTLADACDISGNRRSSFGVEESATVSRALEWIDRQEGAPFLLVYLPIAGHHPYDTPAPGPFPEADEFGRYRNALLYADESLGALREGLVRRGLDRSTLWIVYGDHGEAFGQHAGNYGHTFHLYEENVHVPLVIAAPGLWSATLRSPVVVSLLDLAPTILDLLSVPAPAEYAGRSALELEPQMALFFTDYSLRQAGLRDGRWKFILDLTSGRGKLFDLERDSHEHTNVAEQHRERSQIYARRLQSWIGGGR
jgi:phosphoglycerol transferase MdoB-like AlkP superfamily enzyme